MNASKPEAFAESHNEEPTKRHYTELAMIACIRQARDASTKEWLEFTMKQYEQWRNRPGPPSGMICVYFGSWRIARAAARAQDGTVEETNTDSRRQARACLKCDQQFLSQNRGNRLCDTCRQRNSQERR